MVFFFFCFVLGFGLVPLAAKYSRIWRWYQWPSHPHLECEQWLLHKFPWHSVPGNCTLLDPSVLMVIGQMYCILKWFNLEGTASLQDTNLHTDGVKIDILFNYIGFHNFSFSDLISGVRTQLQGAGLCTWLCPQQCRHLEVPLSHQGCRAQR